MGKVRPWSEEGYMSFERKYLRAVENAQLRAAHASPRTTKLYDRTDDAITPDEVERIVI
jgi:hypothetical protein